MSDTIDLLKINVGLVVKNHEQMCELLGVEYKNNTNSKEAQRKEWARYFNWEKKGQKYIIIDIYDEPLEKSDKRSIGNHSKYVEFIESMLLNILSRQNKNNIQITLKKLFLHLNMINRYYQEIEHNELMGRSDFINEFYINHFYQRTYQKLREIIFSSLKNMSKRKLIDFEMVIIVTEVEEIDGKRFKVPRRATEKEKIIINEIEQEVLQKMGLKNISIVHLKFKDRQFYSCVDQLLFSRYNIDSTYKEVYIEYVGKDPIITVDQVIINEQRENLNKLVIETINQQAVNKLEKNKKKVKEDMGDYWGEPNRIELSKKFTFDEVPYLNSQNELAEVLIKI